MGRALGNLLNLQGIACKSLVSPFWSLSYEVWFYVILGVFAHILLTSRDRTKLVGFILLVAATSVFVLGLKMRYLLIWIMGAVSYIVRPQSKNRFVLIARWLVSWLLFFIFSSQRTLDPWRWPLKEVTRNF